VAISTDDTRRLVTEDLRGPVLSVLLRTDPRDAANTRHAPRWQVALRTALQDITAWVEEHAAREERLALRGLQLEAQRELAGLPAEQRGRGIAWFVSPDRQLDRRFTLQLPPSRDSVRWDARPFVSPLVELVDRGRPVALVLIALDSVRLLTWEGGRVTEPVRSVYDLELGDWRDYAGYAAANPARAQQTATHVEFYEHRVEAWRKRFYKKTGVALGDRLRDLGFSRIVLAAESGLADEFAQLLPDHLAREVIGEPATNLMQEEPADIGERLEPSIRQAWLSSARAALEKTVNAAHAGLPAVLGPDETLQALEARRVDLLTIDPDYPYSVAQLGPAAVASLRTPRDDMVAECAVELALAAGAQVTAMPVAHAEQLDAAMGMAATLRY
jgi:hypothetical protein